jgi:hypothetical protein
MRFLNPAIRLLRENQRPYVLLNALAYGLVLLGMVLVALFPHSLTLLIEVQAYVLVMLGAFVLGRAWLRPASVGAERRRDGYVRGLRSLGRLLVPALVLLVIGALYEAFSLAYLVPLMLGR